MIKTKKTLLLTLIFTLFLGVSCLNNSDSDDPTNVVNYGTNDGSITYPTTSNLSIQVTEGDTTVTSSIKAAIRLANNEEDTNEVKMDVTTIDKAILKVAKIEIASENVGTDENGWITHADFSDVPKSVDLKTLGNGELEELGTKELAPGHYGQIRFFSESLILVVNGETAEIKLPSGVLKLTGGFEIKKGITNILKVKFDLGNSLHKAGSKYILRPTAKLIEEHKGVAIFGAMNKVPEVLNAENIEIALMNGTEEVEKSVLDSNYSFNFLEIDPGEYTIKYGVINQSETDAIVFEGTKSTGIITLNDGDSMDKVVDFAIEGIENPIVNEDAGTDEVTDTQEVTQ